MDVLSPASSERTGQQKGRPPAAFARAAETAYFGALAAEAAAAGALGSSNLAPPLLAM
jgi:hypothetical protein